MTESHKSILEKMAEEISHYTYHMDSHEMKKQIFLAGAAAYDELIQKDYHTKSLFDLTDEIERLKELLKAQIYSSASANAGMWTKDTERVMKHMKETWQQFAKENNLLSTNSTT